MFLVRHPEIQDPLHSTKETPPDAQGKVQAHKVAHFFKDKPVKHIITSPAKRTRYQADAIAKVSGAKVEEDPRLDSWDVSGDSEPEVDAKIDHAIDHPDSVPDTTDETYNQFKTRVQSFHDEHVGDSGTVAVTHSKNIALHRNISTGSPMNAAARKKVRLNHVSEVKPTSFRPLLVTATKRP